MRELQKLSPEKRSDLWRVVWAVLNLPPESLLARKCVVWCGVCVCVWGGGVILFSFPLTASCPSQDYRCQ